jgi:ribosomal protein S18 acetylase RimI-like enzyme
MSNKAFAILPFTTSRVEWAKQKLIEEWGSESIVAHGEIYYPTKLPGFLVELDGNPVGLITYHLTADECEVITLNSWQPGMGIGSTLLDRARRDAQQAGCKRLFLVTTNNNLHALYFYQKRGFVISAIRLNALQESRRLKPEIPMVDDEGIPIRDEIELEISL